MRRIGRHVVINNLAFRHLVEVGLGILVFQQLVDRDDVKRTVAEGEAGRHVQALEDGLDLFLAAVVGDGVDVAEAERADEQRALVAPGHLPRGQHVRCVDFDLEARRQLDLFHQRGEFGVRRAGRRPGRRRQALLRFGLVAEEPVVGRMGPEFLGAGLVFLQRFCLCAGLGDPQTRDPRNGEDGGARNNGSIESRFHRVTPYAAQVEPRLVYCLNATRDELLVWCRVGRPQNATTSGPREKRAPRGPAGRKAIEKKFLQAGRSG